MRTPEPDTSHASQDAALIGAVAAPDVHVMSWNIRRKTGPPHPRLVDHWTRRAPRVRALLQAERPALLGVQEALGEQATFLHECLGGSYRFIGHGRGASGQGEASPIFYDADRFELLDWEQSALSETPQQPGSRSWGNLIPRVLVTAQFRDLQTSARFLMLNTHLDHLSAKSRLRSAQRMRELAAKSSVPVLLTGDFNASGTSDSLAELLRGDALADSWRSSPRHVTPKWGTYANYREPRPDRARIDWILTSPRIEILRTAINAHRHLGGWASDHLPVQAVIRFPEKGSPA